MTRPYGQDGQDGVITVSSSAILDVSMDDDTVSLVVGVISGIVTS